MINRDQIKAAIEQVKATTNKIKVTLSSDSPVPPDQTVREIIDQNIKGLIFKKIEKEINDNLAHYTLDELLQALEIFNEKSEEKAKPGVVRNFPGTEVQPRPTLVTSRKQTVSKTSKGDVSKGV